MADARWLKIEEVFNGAIALPTGRKRAFVAEACGGDLELREEINRMLAEDENNDNLLEQPLFTFGFQLLNSDFKDIVAKSKFANYKVRRLLGRGGMGAVLLAEDVRLERLVALKVLPATVAPNDEAVLRFQQEARAVSVLSHPNVAHIYEFGSFDGQHFLAMEYVHGITLRDILSKVNPDNRLTVEIALQIAKALVAAHNAGVIHRDIKPENVMISRDRHVKVLDFGLAKFIEPLKFDENEHLKIRTSGKTSLDTTPGMIIGTTAYMSPEQVRGKILTNRTDIWSFGAILYEMIAGKRPFGGETSSDIRAVILLSEPPSLTDSAVLPELEAIARRCLRKNEDDRYQNAEEIVQELRLILKRLSSDEKIRNPDAAENIFLNSGSEKIDSELSERPSSIGVLSKPRSMLLIIILAMLAIILAASGFIYNKLAGSERRNHPSSLVHHATRLTNSGRGDSRRARAGRENSLLPQLLERRGGSLADFR